MIPHFFTLLTRPDKAWAEIRRDEEKNSSNYMVHLFLLALLPAICMFIGTHYTGWSLVEDERIWLDTRSALQLSGLIYATIILGTFIMGFFLRWMSRTFEARPTYNQCVGFIAYIITPFMIAGLGALYPTRWVAITVIVLAGVYATYLLFVGLPTFMRIDNRQTFLYAACTWGVGLLVLVNLKVPMILLWVLALDPTYERNTVENQGYSNEQRAQEEPGGL
ncbi:YIP1 family protein [Stutzerimonas zhaodongensis]|uniref:YIP1 family protein n=1 Tax=Stutzerimonas zhaodongensis TaxID=1176257 RepID=A0A3M2HJC0_9GAMM|nr:Yip1 family protein [Stutzerimonas zhaodongensis]MCQ2029670.1 YIP1 family protein [Stutzerimonas zhaodongensis]MCQ4316110.1 YIP1 family protein [Stutzerimonas zhaodongensis]RMH89831.1 YIP1 family protein [Stutzerimonas zhaodongensis]